MFSCPQCGKETSPREQDLLSDLEYKHFDWKEHKVDRYNENVSKDITPMRD